MKIIIIGAGIGGLATANLLARNGHEVHVYEKASIPGGRAGTLTAQGFTFDTGPSWYLMPEVFERYYKKVGESIDDHLDIIRLDPSYKVFFENNEPISITGNLKKDKLTFEAIEQGAGQKLEQYSNEAEKLYNLALRYFLYTNFSRPRDFLQVGIIMRLPNVVRYMLTPIHRHIEKFVRTTRLQQILEYPMVFLGTSPFEAPALYSLMGALDFKSGVYYPRGGIYTIIQSLVAIGAKAGVSYHYDSPIVSIVGDNGRASAIILESGEMIPADIVISNADLQYTETKLLAPQNQSYPDSYWQKRQASSSALLLYIGVKGSADELEHHNLLFVDTWRENFDALYKSKTIPEKASLYVSRTSATDPHVSPVGHETLFVLVPLPAGIELSKQKVDELSRHYITQIETMTTINISDRIVYQSAFTPSDFGSTLHSWQNSMLGPSHVLKQSALWRTPNRSKRLKNLYYVGAGTTPGVGLPMCLISASNLVDRLQREQGV